MRELSLVKRDGGPASDDFDEVGGLPIRLKQGKNRPVRALE